MRRPHLDIRLTEEQDRILKKRAKEKGMCKTDYALMKIFQMSSEDFLEKKDSDDDDLISLKEFASKAAISLAKARRMCRDNKIDYYRIGGSIRVKRGLIKEMFHPGEDLEEDETYGTYLNTGQASDYLTVTRATILKWIKTGTLKAAFIGKRYLIAREDLDRMLLEQRATYEN